MLIQSFIIYATHPADFVQFRCVVLALQNPYLGPAIITRVFIFFIFIAYRKLKLNYAKAFLTFDPLISLFISPTVQLRLTSNLSQALTCLCPTTRTNFVIKTTNATSKD